EENVAADAFSRICEKEFHPAELNLAEEEDLPQVAKRKIRQVHNTIAGHHGVEKTLQKLNERGALSWPHMRDHVKQYIKNCPICQKLDQRSVSITTIPFTLASNAPMK